MKQLVYLPADTFDLVSGNRPPTYKLLVGDGSWRATGSEFLRLFISLGHLRPDDHVLDVGCGIGRIVSALTRYLSPRGTYHGFDIVKQEIEWCSQNISKRFPRFLFSWANIRNAHYNPVGIVPASEYRFPFPNDSFNFVYLTSVFTHMLPPDLDNYVSGISRVIRPGGHVLMTMFLMNDESLRCIAERKSFLEFSRTTHGNVGDPSDPEAVVGYEELYIRNRMSSVGLPITEPIAFGAWPGRGRFTSYQDILVAQKR